jgi:hypothetical protein
VCTNPDSRAETRPAPPVAELRAARRTKARRGRAPSAPNPAELKALSSLGLRQNRARQTRSALHEGPSPARAASRTPDGQPGARHVSEPRIPNRLNQVCPDTKVPLRCLARPRQTSLSPPRR